jgi:hypothetical protein
MKSELRKPDLGHYKEGSHVEFHVTMHEILKKYKALADTEPLLSVYQAKIRQEERVFKFKRRNDFTRKKRETNFLRGEVFKGMRNLIRACKKRSEPALRDHAARLSNVVENYGDLSRAIYNVRTAGIDHIVEILSEPAYSASVEALCLDSWLAELTQLNTLAKDYAAKVEEENVRKIDVSSRIARKETDRALRAIADRITAQIILDGEGAFQTLVAEFNVHVEHYNAVVREHYGRLHATVDISSANIATIGVQRYTGEPVYVIPKVKVRSKKKDGEETEVVLVFGKDFTVSYKNNIGPGTAQMEIKGIEGYSGSIRTGFNIEKMGNG